MGLFVMKFSLNKLQRAKEKDAAILKAWKVNNLMDGVQDKQQPKKDIKLPFYSNKTNKGNNPYGAYM